MLSICRLIIQNLVVILFVNNVYVRVVQWKLYSTFAPWHYFHALLLEMYCRTLNHHFYLLQISTLSLLMFSMNPAGCTGSGTADFTEKNKYVFRSEQWVCFWDQTWSKQYQKQLPLPSCWAPFILKRKKTSHWCLFISCEQEALLLFLMYLS